HARTIRVPCHQVGTLAAVERVRGELSVAQGREPTVEEIAAVLGVTAEETQSLRGGARHPVSLHEPLGGGGERAVEDFLDDPDAQNPGKAVGQRLPRADRGGVAVADAARARGDRAALRPARRPAADAGGGGAGVRHYARADPADRGSRVAEAPAAVAQPALAGVRRDRVTPTGPMRQ